MSTEVNETRFYIYNKGIVSGSDLYTQLKRMIIYVHIYIYMCVYCIKVFLHLKFFSIHSNLLCELYCEIFDDLSLNASPIHKKHISYASESKPEYYFRDMYTLSCNHEHNPINVMALVTWIRAYPQNIVRTTWISVPPELVNSIY